MEHVKKYIKPPGYNWDLLNVAFENSCLQEKCEFIFWNNDLYEVAHELTQIMKGDLDLEEIPTLLVAAMIIFLARNKPEFSSERIAVLTNALKCSDSLDPMQIHIFMERIVSVLKLDVVSTAYNYLTISNRIANISIVGKPLAVCMLWVVISEVTNSGALITMHRYREISDLIEMLNMLVIDNFLDAEGLKKIYALVNAVSLLLSLVLYGSNEYLKSAGYPDQFFNISLSQGRALYNWFTNLIRKIVTSQCMDEYYELRNVIIDHVNFVLLSSLNDRMDAASNSGDSDAVSG